MRFCAIRLFEPLQWDRALYLPPFAGSQAARMSEGGNGWGGRFLPGVPGLHLVEAGKTLYGLAKPRQLKRAESTLAPA